MTVASKSLPVGPPSQLPRPTASMSAPTTPSTPVQSFVTSPSSLTTSTLITSSPSANLGPVPLVPQPWSELPANFCYDLEQGEISSFMYAEFTSEWPQRGQIQPEIDKDCGRIHWGKINFQRIIICQEMRKK